jgi:UDP-N-acetylglucosamine acyltransferase
MIGAGVRIAARTRLMGHVFAEGPLEIGEDNLFFPYTTVGVAPQDLKYKGERSETRIGNRNRIREFVTIHRGTEGGGMSVEVPSVNRNRISLVRRVRRERSHRRPAPRHGSQLQSVR